jgi:uncharacterized FAD-dependent dehydrogenase
MKAKLKRLSNQLGKKINAELQANGAITFADLKKIISTGQTNLVVLDLTGKPKPVHADAMGIKPTKKHMATERLSKLEKAIRKALNESDDHIQFEKDDQAILLLYKSNLEPKTKKYKTADVRLREAAEARANLEFEELTGLLKEIRENPHR